jgi:hypothetical protein
MKPLTRDAIKASFRLAINKSTSRTEARKINKLRARYLSGNLTPDEAMIGWLDLTLTSKPPRTVTNERGVTRVVA